MKKLKKILLIDDDEITCYLEKSLLEDLEVAEEIVCADNGHKALKHLQNPSEEEYPDLIFLDINMPGMDGFQFLETIRDYRDIDTKKLFIVMLTSSINIRDIQKAASFGDLLKGFITKPLDIKAVKNILDLMEKDQE